MLCVCLQFVNMLCPNHTQLLFLVEYTVESLYLFYHLFISRIVFTSSGHINKLGLLHAIQTSICLDLHHK